MWKISLFVILAAFFAANIQAKSRKSKPCPNNIALKGTRLRNNEPCDEEGFFGDILDCRKFYRCASHPNPDGSKVLSKYEFKCPPGTIYDDSISSCNHPASVENPPKDCSAEEPPATDESEQGGYKSITPILLSYTPGWIPHFPVSNYLIPVLK